MTENLGDPCLSRTPPRNCGAGIKDQLHEGFETEGWKSDHFIVVRATGKPGTWRREWQQSEARKGNMIQKRQPVTDMRTSLRGIANRAKRDKKARFRNLYGLLNEANLRECFQKLKRSAAPGVDGVTVAQYESDLEANLQNLVERLKGNRYKARLIRRKMIPKAGGKLRPLGIPVLEDKLVQLAAANILNAIYEEDFLETSWGYRPGRGAREASRILAGRLAIGKYHTVVEADIRGFFDCIDHSWLMKMIEQRVHDAAFCRLISKWLKAGILTEAKEVIHPASGTPQGGIISPILANIYLHYALDLWFEKKVRPAMSGQAMIMRYADDFVCAFQHRDEAEAFMTMLTERLSKFSLELAEEKSGLVAFSRYRLKENGSFAFLGFRYHWTLSRKGKPKVQRMTDPKKLQASVRAFSEWIRAKRHQRTTRLMVTLRRKLSGYWNYYGVTGNFPSLGKFWWKVLGLLYKWLNRRSHKRSYKWKALMKCLEDFGVPAPRITETAYEKPREEQLWLII